MNIKRIVTYGVAVVFLAVGVSISAKDFPNPTGFVNDFANVISANDEAQITRIAESVKKATGAEVVVVTVSALGNYGSIEQYSTAIWDEWGIGQSGKDNGVLLIVAMQERKMRIEVGYGLEGAIPDGLAGRIRDTSMTPYFSKNDFGTGFLKSVEAIAGIVAKEYNVDLPNVSLSESEKYAQTQSRLPRIPIRLIVIVIFMLLGGGGRLFWPMLFLSGGSRSHRGGFGSSSRGGFGGGGGSFGGFGGGSSGGGGASGSF